MSANMSMACGKWPPAARCSPKVPFLAPNLQVFMRLPKRGPSDVVGLKSLWEFLSQSWLWFIITYIYIYYICIFIYLFILYTYIHNVYSAYVEIHKIYKYNIIYYIINIYISVYSVYIALLQCMLILISTMALVVVNASSTSWSRSWRLIDSFQQTWAAPQSLHPWRLVRCVWMVTYGYLAPSISIYFPNQVYYSVCVCV